MAPKHVPRHTFTLKDSALCFASSLHLRQAIIFNCSPILTRTPTPFECLLCLPTRLQRALHLFLYEFYFEPGSLLDVKFGLGERIATARPSDLDSPACLLRI